MDLETAGEMQNMLHSMVDVALTLLSKQHRLICCNRAVPQMSIEMQPLHEQVIYEKWPLQMNPDPYKPYSKKWVNLKEFVMSANVVCLDPLL